jgi:putative FmdB family regulatory protein
MGIIENFFKGSKEMPMPIFEFRCLKCENLFEILVLSGDEEAEMKCPACRSEQFERVMSASGYCMGGTGSTGSDARVQTRSCSGGSCTTYDFPGPSK